MAGRGRWFLVGALVAMGPAACGGGSNGTDPGPGDVVVPADRLEGDVPAADADATGTRDLAADAVPDAVPDTLPADPGMPPADTVADAIPADPGGTDTAPGDPGATDPGPSDPGATDLAPADSGPSPCPRLPAAADRVRKVLVSLPYADGGSATAWTVLDLGTDGQLSATGAALSMGTAYAGPVAFTPDGRVALAVQDDGTLGVVRFGDDGTPEVVHAGFAGTFYAGGLVMAPAGDHAYVLDQEWRNIGGGVYRVDIGCDGTLTDRGLVAAAQLPRALLPLPGRADRAVLAADDVLDAPAGNDVHLLAWGDAPSVLTDALAFEGEAIVTGAGVTPDGKYVLLGDNDEFSGLPNRVAVVAVDGDALSVPQVLTPIEDPVGILAAPAGGTVLVVSGYGNALFVLDRGTDAATPFALRGEVAYVGGKPQLPGAAAMVDRGGLSGRVLVTEVDGVRSVDLGADGSVTDRGVFPLGAGTTGMPGTIGVQP